MTDNSRSSPASYAYYSFPPTPNRGIAKDHSKESTPSTLRTSKSMAPSPATGRTEPQTPTRSGKKPDSSSTSKLTPSQEDVKAPSTTPRKPPKLGASKATPKNTPKPKSVAKDVQEESDDQGPRIGLKDNDPSDTGEKLTGKQSGHDTGASNTSVGEPSELSEAQPEPMSSDDEDITVSGARDTANDAAKDLGTETEGDDQDGKAEGDDQGGEAEGDDQDGEAEDEGKGGALDGLKSAAGGVTKGVSGLAGRAGGVEDTAGNAAQKVAGGDVQGAAGDTTNDVKDTAEGVTSDAQDTAEDTVNGVKETGEGATEDVQDTAETAQGAKDDPSGAAEGLKDKVQDTADDAKDTAEETTGDVKDTAEDATGEVKDTVEETAEDAKEKAEEATEGLQDLSLLKGLKVGENGDIADQSGKVIGKLEEGDPADLEGYEIGDDGEIVDEDGDVIGRANLLPDQVDGAADQVKDTADGAADEAQEAAEGAVEEVETYLPDIDVLKGLEVQENGDILDKDGNVLGRIDEGDPADLVGMTLNEEGEVLDEDGDVIGRAVTLPQEVNEKAEDVQDQLPGLDVLEGLEVGEDGAIKDASGNVLGKITEGDPADLVGKTLNAEGEVLDEDGDVIGRAETVPQEIKDKAEDVQGQLPGLDALEGLEVGEDGAIKDASGNVLGKITEGDPADLAGKTLNAEGEVLDEDGDVIGRAEIVPEAAEAVKDTAEELSPELEKVQQLEEQLKPNLDIVEGKKVNKKGNILDEEGEVLAKLVEGDVKQCAGKIPNENGEILDDDGNVIGRVEVVHGEAAEQAMQEAHPELVEELEEAKKAAEEAEDKAQDAADAAGEAADQIQDAAEQAAALDFSILEGLKVNKKGQVLNEDGEPLAKLSDGYNLDDVRGKKINASGEIVDADGNVIGKVEFLPEAIEEGLVETIDQTEELSTSVLEGYKVNKKGEVYNEDGELLARLSEGELEKVAGKKLNDKGEVLDKDGNVIGKVEMVTQEAEEAGEAEEAVDDGLPPLSILDGLKVNKSGKLIDRDGNVVGELIEGDAKKIWKAGLTCDAEGQFWDNRGNIIGRAKTLPREDEEGEAEFAGLEGLIVVADGMVEDENGNVVGKLVEGDAKKLIGRAVDEDGDVIDKKGNVVGHAERYSEPEAEEEAPIDLSSLKGLRPNKQGNVIGPDGVPIGRVVEGNVKELAGRTIDENGQIWNDSGKVIGRCELIPPEEREAKPEGPFAGLEGLVVRADGFVEDHEGKVVGKLVDGDAKKLAGRGVDEDGDVVDKYGNVKGHAEPYEVPEEEVIPEDLSSLAGKTVNKSGKVVDEHGTIFGEVIEGDVKRLVGCKVDGEGQIWSNDGKVIGRASLISGGDDGRAEGPFSNFEQTEITKDGLVLNASGDVIGRITEGDVKKLVGRKVDDDGDITDKNGNVIGHAERWEPEKKEREVSAMSGLRVNKEGEVRDKNGDTIGRLTAGNLSACIGKTIDDNGNVVDQDGNKLGEVTLLENIPDEEPEGPTEEEILSAEERDTANKIANILNQTLDQMEPICKQITELIEKADRTPRDELDEEKLVADVKPLIEEGNRILGECNGAIRGLDPDGHIAAQAKARAASGDASPEEHRVAEGLKELTTQVVKTVDNAKKRIADMPHAKKKLNPLWGLLTEPLFQIIAAVGLLLSGVLGLVGKLLNGLGLGGLVNGILGGLGVDKLLGGMGLGSISEALGLGGKKKKG